MLMSFLGIGSCMEIYQDILSLFVAALLGAIVGLEREFDGKPAGLRTNMLICIGAAAFTVLSVHLETGQNGSPSRIAAQIVSGIGFLGAGAIIQDRGGVQGLTTAASIWLVASIGVACGSGQYAVATVTTILALLALVVFRPVTKMIHKKSREKSGNVEKSSQEDNAKRL